MVTPTLTARQVWQAFEAIPDPEIPIVSLVDLGVIRSVDVQGDHVQVEFTPTFLGCPALEVMKRALEDSVASLGAEADVQVIQDDSWSTDKITPAGREKLRAAGFAPPAPREASAAGAGSAAGEAGDARPRTGSPSARLGLIQLQSKIFRCPYCGSTETKLENIFGPTPCRSLRYCESCRQPFEQFKTI
jgi:ring-1,2-phenylacetyl-CoA epoxidase subunit PaaD